MDFTTRLALSKPDPDPVTGDDVDVQVLNDNFDALDAVVSFTECTSTARPAVPFVGQAILETDTGKTYVWGGSGWLPLLGDSPQFSRIGIGSAPSGIAARLVKTWGPGGGSASQVLLQTSASATGHRALSVMGGADTQDRWWVDFDGSMQWSSGAAGGDLSLKRAAAGVLDISTGTLTVGGAHPGAPASFAKYATPGTFTWTKPAKAQKVRVRIVGGGGAGGAAAATNATAGQHTKGGGGGGGCYAEKWFDAIDLTATVSVTVGAGATGGTSGNGPGGGTTYFGPTATPYLSAAGGAGGIAGAQSGATWANNGGVGGSATAGAPDVTIVGYPGHAAIGSAGLASGGAGGSSAMGGGAGGTQLASSGSIDGLSAPGAGGGGSGGAVGGASQPAGSGGNGGAGLVIIETYY